MLKLHLPIEYFFPYSSPPIHSFILPPLIPHSSPPLGRWNSISPLDIFSPIHSFILPPFISPIGEMKLHLPIAYFLPHPSPPIHSFILPPFISPIGETKLHLPIGYFLPHSSHPIHSPLGRWNSISPLDIFQQHSQANLSDGLSLTEYTEQVKPKLWLFKMIEQLLFF